MKSIEETPGQVGRLPGLGEFSTPEMIRLVSQHDPRLGYCMIAGGMGWEAINIVGLFESTDANQAVSGQVGCIPSDLWVQEVRTTVRRPNAFPGSVLKAQADYYNSLNSNIDVTLEIDSFVNYVISSDPTPLENLAIQFDCKCPPFFILGCTAEISATFTNRRALASDEVPTEAVITLHGISLPKAYRRTSPAEAVRELQGLGILPANFPVPKDDDG